MGRVNSFRPQLVNDPFKQLKHILVYQKKKNKRNLDQWVTNGYLGHKRYDPFEFMS